MRCRWKRPRPPVRSPPGPKIPAASNLSFGSSIVVIVSTPAHLTRVSLLSQPGTRPGIRPVIPRLLVGGPGLPSGVSCRLSTYRHSLLGSSCSRRGVEPSSQSADRPPVNRQTDPVGVTTFRTHKIRPGWVPSLPRGRRCSPGRMPCPTSACRISTARPCTPPITFTARGSALRGINEGSRDSPVRSSPACDHRMERRPLGTSSGFAPRGYPRRTPRRERSSRTGPDATSSALANLLRRESLPACDFRVARPDSAMTRRWG